MAGLVAVGEAAPAALLLLLALTLLTELALTELALTDEPEAVLEPLLVKQAEEADGGTCKIIEVHEILAGTNFLG